MNVYSDAFWSRPATISFFSGKRFIVLDPDNQHQVLDLELLLLVKSKFISVTFFNLNHKMQLLGA